MIEHNTYHDMAARSAPRRLLGPSPATGGETGPNLNTAAEDEGVAPNSVSGSAAPEGRRMERNGIHLRKKAVFATLNIRGANTAKRQDARAREIHHARRKHHAICRKGQWAQKRRRRVHSG